VTLDSGDRPALRHPSESDIVLHPSDHVVLGRRNQCVAVREIEVRPIRYPFEQRRAPGVVHLVPPDMRKPHPAADILKMLHLSRDEIQPRGAATFLPVRREQLHAEADTEERPFCRGMFSDGLKPTTGVEYAHRRSEPTYARQENTRCLPQRAGIGRNFGVNPDTTERTNHRTDVASFIPDDVDRHGLS
jgi:hypothetical protein